MKDESQWIDAVEMSRRLRIETGDELAEMSPQERVRFLNAFVQSDPVLGKVPKATIPRRSRKSK